MTRYQKKTKVRHGIKTMKFANKFRKQFVTAKHVPRITNAFLCFSLNDGSPTSYKRKKRSNCYVDSVIFCFL
jgi:hypothetical protein